MTKMGIRIKLPQFLIIYLTQFSFGLGLNVSDIHEEIQETFYNFDNPIKDISGPGGSKIDNGNLMTGPAEIRVDTTMPKSTRIPISDYAIMILLCNANVDGNYQNPFNCNQFIMCAGGRPFLWECPASGSYYPTRDMCISKPEYPVMQCPWRIMWHVSGVNCAIMGERPWWSPLTIPMDPDVRCGARVRYCLRYKEVGIGECPSGYGYSKVYNACLPKVICLMMDSFFWI